MRNTDSLETCHTKSLNGVYRKKQKDNIFFHMPLHNIYATGHFLCRREGLSMP